MDLVKILKSTLVPILLLILLSILEAISAVFAPLFVLVALLALGMLIYVYSGYSAVKKYELGWKSAFIAAFVYSIIDSVLVVLFVLALNAPLLSAMFGTMLNMSNETMGNPSTTMPVMEAGLKGLGPFILLTTMPFILIIRFFINILAGIILGAIGGLVAQRTKPKSK
jgi:hypothetical protein